MILTLVPICIVQLYFQLFLPNLSLDIFKYVLPIIDEARVRSVYMFQTWFVDYVRQSLRLTDIKMDWYISQKYENNLTSNSLSSPLFVGDCISQDLNQFMQIVPLYYMSCLTPDPRHGRCDRVITRNSSNLEGLAPPRTELLTAFNFW